MDEKCKASIERKIKFHDKMKRKLELKIMLKKECDILNEKYRMRSFAYLGLDAMFTGFKIYNNMIMASFSYVCNGKITKDRIEVELFEKLINR